MDWKMSEINVLFKLYLKKDFENLFFNLEFENGF